jgi:hypothetical protein
MTQGSLRPSGVVTFGQPALADQALGSHMAQQLGGNYVRFVNERDVVTRVPPGYLHFGTQIWFHDGAPTVSRPRLVTLASTSPESPAAGDGILQPLSLAEYEAFQRSLRELRQPGKKLDTARLQAYGENVVAITDHFMNNYLRGIQQSSKNH